MVSSRLIYGWSAGGAITLRLADKTWSVITLACGFQWHYGEERTSTSQNYECLMVVLS